MSSVIQKELKGYKTINKSILKKALKQFDNDGFEYSKISDNELVIIDKTKDDVLRSISKIDGVSSKQSKILLDVISAKEKVYVRKKYE